MARVALTIIDITVAGHAETSSTTIGAVGAYAVVVTTALPDRGVTLASSYLAAMIGTTAASHLCSTPAREPRIAHRVLPGPQPGQTHAQSCLLDHVAELQAQLAELTEQTVTIDLDQTTLELADRAWHAQDQPAA